MAKLDWDTANRRTRVDHTERALPRMSATTARRSSSCRTCGDRIYTGDEIATYRHINGWAHLACLLPEPAAASGRPQPVSDT